MLLHRFIAIGVLLSLLAYIAYSIPPSLWARVWAEPCQKLCDIEFIHTATPAAVKAVLAKGANVNARDNDGLAPLHTAAAKNDNPAVIMGTATSGRKHRR